MNVFNDIYLERENFEDRELLEKLKCFGEIKNLEEASEHFNLRRNETTFISLFKCINAIVRLFEHVDVTDLDTSTIESYFEYELDVEEYFGQFPEFNKYTDFNIHLGPNFVYRFNV